MDHKNEDQQWLDSLAGRNKEGDTDSVAQSEAQAIRKIVLRQIQTDERRFETTAACFEKLMDAAKQKGLLRAAPRVWNPMLVLQDLYEVLARPASVIASIALIVSLGMALQLRPISEPIQAGDETLRSGVSAERVTLRVDDARAVAAEWQKELTEAGVEYSVSFDSQQRILIRFRLTPASQAIVQRRRIPPPAGAWCTLAIETVRTRQP